MPAAVALRPDWEAKRVRAAAREAKNADQARRLLAIAAAYEGQDRSAAAKIGAMDPQRLRDWLHRFNAAGPQGVIDRKPAGAVRRLTPEQEAELATLIEAGPDVERDGVVRWRCVDLKQLILTRWNLAYHEGTMASYCGGSGSGTSRRARAISGRTRPRSRRSKKLRRAGGRGHGEARPKNAHRSLVSGRNAPRSEKPAHPALGAARHQTAGTHRPAHQIGLCVWCNLS
jgi:transposase